MIAIIVNGTELDITDETRSSLALTVGLTEAGDLLKRSPEFAPSVTIPATVKNNKVLNYLNQNGIKTGNTWLPCVIYDYPELLLNGSIQILSFNGDSYQCACFSSQLDVIQTLKDTKLKALNNLDELDHIWDNIPISERIEPTQELLYLRADNGLYRNSPNLTMAPIDLKPAISLQAVIDRMNDTLPFTVNCDAIPDRTTTMLINGKVLKYSDSYVAEQISNTAELIAPSVGINQFTRTESISLGSGASSGLTTVPPPNRITARADSPVNNNIYYDNNIGINVFYGQKVKIKLSFSVKINLTTSTEPVPVTSFVRTDAVLTFRSDTETVYIQELNRLILTGASGTTQTEDNIFQVEFDTFLKSGTYYVDIDFNDYEIGASKLIGAALGVDITSVFQLVPTFEVTFATFEGSSEIVRGGLMRGQDVIPDLTCFDVIQHLAYQYGCTINLTRNSLGQSVGIELIRYAGKSLVPFRGKIDFTNKPAVELGLQSFLRDNRVGYKVDENDTTTLSGAVATFVCQHTQPNTERDWYTSPFAILNNANVFLNQLQIGSIPNYVLPFGSRYIITTFNDTLLQVNDYVGIGWVLYKVLVNCTYGTLFDDEANYEVVSYSDLGARDLVDKIARVLTVPSTLITLTDGAISPVEQELKYNIVPISFNTAGYGSFETAIERNRSIEVEAFLTQSDFRYLSTNLFTGIRFNIPEFGTDCYLQKIETYTPFLNGKAKLTFLTL
jgi:hypothetical protein